MLGIGRMTLLDPDWGDTSRRGHFALFLEECSENIHRWRINTSCTAFSPLQFQRSGQSTFKIGNKHLSCSVSVGQLHAICALLDSFQQTVDVFSDGFNMIWMQHLVQVEREAPCSAHNVHEVWSRLLHK